MGEAAELLENIEYATDSYDCIDGADCLVIVTEWNQFRALSLPRIKDLLNAPIIVDLRNIYSPKEMRDMGFDYTSIGRRHKRIDEINSVYNQKAHNGKRAEVFGMLSCL